MTIQWPAWFSSVAAATIAELGAVAVRQRFPSGAILFFEGDPAHHVLVIQEGAVKLTNAAAHGREVVLDVLGVGEVFGELAAIDGGTRSATATALARTDVIAIPSTSFQETARTHPDLLNALLIEVIRRLRASDQRQLEFGNDALGRVCARLVHIADRQAGASEIVLPVSQSELAGWTGLSREAVVKALAALRRLGWITTEGRQFVLVQPEEIRRRARSG